MYTSIKYMVLSYKVSKTNYLENYTLNKQLSHIQINIKHIFKMFKKRYKSLIGM